MGNNISEARAKWHYNYLYLKGGDMEFYIRGMKGKDWRRGRLCQSIDYKSGDKALPTCVFQRAQDVAEFRHVQ